MPRLGKLDRGTRDYGERDTMPHNSHLYEWSPKQIVDPKIPWGATFDRLFADEIAELNAELDECDDGEDAGRRRLKKDTTMDEESKIPWTEYVFNPWIGCEKVGPGCLNCYATHRWAPRAGRTGCYGPHGRRERTTAAYWRKPLAWNAKAERDGTRPFVFCGSLCDIFEENHIYVTDGISVGSQSVQNELWDLIERTPCLQYLVLTKRPQNIDVAVPEPWRLNGMANVWPGVSICNRREARTVRQPFVDSGFVQNSPKCFASFEPLLEKPDPVLWLYSRFDWIIAGCESGGKRRHVDAEAFRTLRDCANRAEVPFFLKQMEVGGKVVEMPELDGKVWNQMPEVLR